jgi:hypothetical protein
MKVHIVAEGAIDVALLKAVLRPEADKRSLHFIAAGGRSSAESYARTVTAVRQEPAVLVLDADAYAPAAVRERQDTVMSMLRQVALPRLWQVCLAVPEIETLLFADLAGIERFFQTKLTGETKVEARFQPREVLERLFRERGLAYTANTLPQLLRVLDLNLLRETPLVREVRDFLGSLPSEGAA